MRSYIADSILQLIPAEPELTGNHYAGSNKVTTSRKEEKYFVWGQL